MLSCGFPAGWIAPLAANQVCELSFVRGFWVSAFVYWTLNHVFQVVRAADTFEEFDVSCYEDKAKGSRNVEEMNTDTKDAG
jgi:NCS1 family nucleobase:cation symporter-1